MFKSVVDNRKQALTERLYTFTAALEKSSTYARTLAGVLVTQFEYLTVAEVPITQRQLQSIERTFATARLSGLMHGLNLKELETLDLWDIEPGYLSPLVSEDRCNTELFNIALDYYGLPDDIRVLKSVPTIELKADGTPKTRLEWTSVEQAAESDTACWVVVNQAAPLFQGTKPGNADIITVNNITLDFEYPPEPGRVHAVAVEFADWLVKSGYAEPGLPVEDSGAGSHIVLPVLPVRVHEHGGPLLVNQAIAEIVSTYFKPEFDNIARRWQLDGVLKLEAFDISRIFSLPGTWRPGGHKPNEAAHLLPGYMRRYLPPFDRIKPVRHESETLTEMVKAMCVQIAERPKEVKPEPKPVAGLNLIDVKVWLERYAANHPPQTWRKNGSGFDRSAYFHKLVLACHLKFGDYAAAQSADLIDGLSGNKYGRLARKEVERSLRTA